MSSSESSRRFHFIREIASGGFGSVYLTKVIHADGFSRLVAVKLLHPRWSENEEIASRMRDEARLLGWLRHKNIVDVMDLTLIDGRCAVIMEYLDSVDLKEIINACKDAGARVPLRAALETCAAVANALDAAYNRPPYAGEKPLRVIHRDIKPSNIMVDDSGVVKVLDFGVARAEFDERESKTQEMAFGSLEYMPPERLFFEPESPASDVYSLGATLFEMLALEKFGKAKLRPKEHESYFEDRFDALLDAYPMHRETEDLLHELLMGMLAFDEPERPSAADAVSQMRTFARRIKEGSLEEWAEEVVPPLLKIRADEPESKSPGSLVGAVLVEDAKALDQRSIWDENTGASSRSIEYGMSDDELTGRLAEDERWKAIKAATMEDLARKGVAPTTERPEPEAAPTLPQGGKPLRPDFSSPPPTVERHISPNSDISPGSEFDDLAGDATVRLPAPKLPPRVPRTHQTPLPAPVVPPPSAMLPPTAASPQGFDTEPTVAQAIPIPSPPQQPPQGRSFLGTVLFGLLFGSGLAMVVAAVVLLIVLLVVSPQGGTPGPQPRPTPAPVAEPEPVPEATEPTGPHATFKSAAKDTSRLRVNCRKGEGSGRDVAYVEGNELGRCTVVAVLESGKRLRTKIEDVATGTYTCFSDGSDSCSGP